MYILQQRSSAKQQTRKTKQGRVKSESYRHKEVGLCVLKYEHNVESDDDDELTTMMMMIPRSLHKTIGDRAFPVAAARVWNMLPPKITSLPSLQTSKRALKTELFCRSYDNAH